MEDKQRFDRRFYVNTIAVDPLANQIVRDGEAVDVTPKVIQILQYMAQHQGDVVTSQALADNVWKGFVSESALYQQITQVRKALGETPGKPTTLRTVPRQGYKLIANVGFDAPTNAQDTPPSDNNLPCTKQQPHSQQTPSISATQLTKNKSPKALLIKAVCSAFVLLLASVALLFIGKPLHTSSQTAAPTSPQRTNLAKLMSYPASTVALEVFERNTPSNTTPELLPTLERLVKHHIEQQAGQHFTRILPLNAVEFYQRLQDHYAPHSHLTTIIRTQTHLNDRGQLLVQLHFQQALATTGANLADSHESSPVLNIAFDIDNPAAQLPLFEQQLIATLQKLDLIPADASDNVVLTQQPEANQAFLAAFTPWSKSSPSRHDLETGINASKQAIALNPTNVVAYEVLFNQASWLLKGFEGEFNLEEILDIYQHYGQQLFAMQLPPFHAQHALASYHCWLEELDRCADWLTQALKTRPYDARLLRTLNTYLTKSEQNTLPLAAYHYELYPFTGNSLYYYRNMLIKHGRLDDATQLMSQHTFRNGWNHWPPVWRLEAQKRFQISTLQDTANWYQNHTSSASNSDKDAISPSKYVGYMLLSSNQIDLARQWAQQGREQDRPGLSFHSIELLADLWEGQWRADNWRSARDLATNRRRFLSAYDHLRIAYFDYVTGHLKNSEQAILQVYPEFVRDNTPITRNNVRFAVYYAEINKRQGNFKKAALMNADIREFLQAQGDKLKRTLGVGLADVEFYALNSDKEKALSALEQAINQQGWLANAYWLWVPIEHNPFLTTLATSDRFKLLVKQQRQQLEHLCFETQEYCSTKQSSK